MTELLHLINENAIYAPYITFIALILSGLNIPISEDLLIVCNGLLAASHKEMVPQLYLGIFIGAYLSDLLCFSLGKHLGLRLFNQPLWRHKGPPRQLKKVERHFEKHDIATLILGRFIPFGVRNAIYIAAGLSRYSSIRFAVTDFFAALFSTSLLFFLVYRYGQSVVSVIQETKLIIFIAAMTALTAFVAVKLYRRWKRKHP